ncbi:MAG: type II secretion system F family protein [Planctomycetaceae bacterium]
MPRFRYTSIDESGRPASGEREAVSGDELRAALESEGHRVDTVEVVEPVGVEEPTRSAVQLTDKDFASLGDSIASVTTAGLPLESGLRALSEEIPSRRMKGALRSISDRLSRGEPLGEIVAGDIPGAPPALREVIRAGLATEQPGVILEAWSEQTRRAGEVGRTIWGGLLYSLLLLSVLLLVVAFFLTVIIPQSMPIFEDFGTELPGLTKFIIRLSSLLTGYWAGVLTGVAVLVVVAVVVCASTGARFRHRIIAWVPLIGSARRNASLATFCHLLAVLVERRVPFPAALQAAGAGSRDGVIEAACRELAVDVQRGQAVTHAATDRRLPPQLAQVFRWSNHPETFPEALRGSAAVFEGQARAQARLVPKVLEPIMIFGVGFCLLLFVVAMFLPLIKLISDLT